MEKWRLPRSLQSLAMTTYKGTNYYMNFWTDTSMLQSGLHEKLFIVLWRI